MFTIPLCAQYQFEATTKVLPQGIALPPVDKEAPAISRVEAKEITTDSALIYWETNEFSSSIVDYGLTLNYELGTVTDKTGSLFIIHRVILRDLKPVTRYYFRVRSIDNFGNEAISEGHTFTTLSLLDKIPPANISAFRAEGRDKEIFLSWINPPDPDFTKVRIERREDTFPLNPGEGFLVYEGKETSCLDKNLINGKRYYYTAWAYDEVGNFSSGTLASAVPQALILPRPPVKPEIPKKIEPPLVVPKIPEAPVLEVLPERIILEDISFFLKYDLLKIQPLEDKIRVLPGFPLTFSIPLEKLPEPVRMIQVIIKTEQAYLLRLNEEKKVYEGAIRISEIPGTYSLIVVIIYESNRVEIITSEIVVESYGEIKEAKDKRPIPGALVTLWHYNAKEGKWEIWDGGKYDQKNPQLTNEKGEYGFMVPPDKYYLTIAKEGYFTKKTDVFRAEDGIINFKMELVSLKVVIKHWVWPAIVSIGILILLALIVLWQIFWRIIVF